MNLADADIRYSASTHWLVRLDNIFASVLASLDGDPYLHSSTNHGVTAGIVKAAYTS